ncbi:MAG: HAMP domain-containing sensor histidine kinase, partial [Elusimicrobiota bacterium]
MSILTKFSIFATLLILLVVSSISLFIFVSQRRLIIDDLEAQRENAIAGVVSIAKESILTRDDILLLNYVNFIKKNTRALLTCMVVDNKNFIIAHSNPEYLRKKIGETIVLPGGKKIVVEAYSLEPFFEPTIRMSVPVMVGTKKIAKVHMEYSNKALRKIINDNLILIGNKIMLSGGITLLLGIFISYVFAHTMTGPVLKLAEGAHLIGEGNLDTKLKLKTHDELGYLAEEFNKMAQKLKELDRMKDDFVSSVTHELRSPLAAIESYVNLMLDNPQELLNKGSEHLIRIKNNTARLGRFIDDLLDVAKIESGTMFIKKEKINIYPVLLEICSFFQLPAREKGIKLEMNL